MTQKLGNTLGLFKRISFIVIILKQEFNDTCREKNHSLFHKIYIIERNSSEKKYSIREGIDENLNEITSRCRERTEFCIVLQLCARIRSDEKISRKLYT